MLLTTRALLETLFALYFVNSTAYIEITLFLGVGWGGVQVSQYVVCVNGGMSCLW